METKKYIPPQEDTDISKTQVDDEQQGKSSTSEEATASVSSADASDAKSVDKAALPEKCSESVDIEKQLYSSSTDVDDMLLNGNFSDDDGLDSQDICGPEPVQWTRDKALSVLKLSKYANTLESFILDPENQKLDRIEFAEQALICMAMQKWDAGYQDRLRKATFPDCYASEKYDAEQAQCDKALAKRLFKCTWVEKGYTLLLVGGPGLGKTFLAVELGKAAVYKEYTTLFAHAIEFFHKLRKTEKTWGDLPRGPLFTVDLLIVDDIGHLIPHQSEDAGAFFRLIDWRVSRGLSTIFTSNKQPAQWVPSIGGDVETQTASLDRILYKACYVLHKGYSSKRLEAFKKLNKDIRTGKL